VGWVLPAPATELPVPAIHKVAHSAIPAKRPARQSLIRIASAAWPPSASYGSHWPFPIILGVAY
jgi:hypothetical protein